MDGANGAPSIVGSVSVQPSVSRHFQIAVDAGALMLLMMQPLCDNYPNTEPLSERFDDLRDVQAGDRASRGAATAGSLWLVPSKIV